MQPADYDTVVVGGGIIGLAIAWRLQREGFDTLVVEKDTLLSGTSAVAAGMLSPYSETGYDNSDMLKISSQSLQHYRKFLDTLRSDSGLCVPFLERSTLVCAIDSHERNYLASQIQYLQRLGISAEWLQGTQARQVEPLLSPRVHCAIRLPHEASVDPKELLQALSTAFLRLGGTILENTTASKLIVDDGQLNGVTLNRKRLVKAKYVVLAAGVGTPTIYANCHVRPQKGQILTVSLPRNLSLNSTIRSRDIYAVSTQKSSLRVGATTEECGLDARPSAGAIYETLRRSRELLPVLDEAAFIQVDVGHRPTTPSHRPVIGPTHERGLILACGHSRSGLLLAPITALSIALYIRTGEWPDDLKPYRPQQHQHQEPSYEHADT